MLPYYITYSKLLVYWRMSSLQGKWYLSGRFGGTVAAIDRVALDYVNLEPCLK